MQCLMSSQRGMLLSSLRRPGAYLRRNGERSPRGTLPRDVHLVEATDSSNTLIARRQQLSSRPFLKNVFPRLGMRSSIPSTTSRRTPCMRAGIRLSRENSRNHISRTCVPCGIFLTAADSVQLKSFLAKEYQSQTIFPPGASFHSTICIVILLNSPP